MAWFFTEKNIFGNNYTLVGENAKHISKVLRMRTGDESPLFLRTKRSMNVKFRSSHRVKSRLTSSHKSRVKTNPMFL